MRINGKEIEVDIRYELEQFDIWKNLRITEEKWICSSPFRNDDYPAFFVRLKPSEDGEFQDGLWYDSGGLDDWGSGNFTKLYAWLHGITFEEAEDELLEKYDNEYVGYVETIELRIPKLTIKTRKKPLPEARLSSLGESIYLNERGISSSTQSVLGMGQEPKKECIAIPWRDTNGNLVNVKYRSTTTKIFWYEQDGIAISQLVYNLHNIYRNNNSFAVVTESEIDSATFIEAGVPSIALGGANFSRRKAELIIKSPIQKLVIATDNDKVGKKIRKVIKQKLFPYMELYDLEFPLGYKDANDIKDRDILRDLVKKSKKVSKI